MRAGRALEALGLGGEATGVGSLPHTDAASALSLALERCPRVPFWPQLPERHPREGMIAQGLAGLEPLLAPRSVGFFAEDSEALQRALVEPAPWGEAEAQGLVAMERALIEGRGRDARLIKGQLAGPLTLAACLEVGGAPAWRDPALVRALGARVANQAIDQLTRLRRAGHPVLIVLDEPMLGLLPPEALEAGSPAMEALTWALAAISACGGLSGLHCCSAPPWSALTHLPIDVVSFDAASHLHTLLESPDGLAWLTARGVIWGWVPTVEAAPMEPGARAEAWWRALSKVLDPGPLLRRSLFSPACGLAGLGVAEAEARLRAAAALGAILAPRGSPPG